jgi:hypothetical protein
MLDRLGCKTVRLGVDCRQLRQQTWRMADCCDGFGHVGRFRLQLLTLALERQDPVCGTVSLIPNLLQPAL